MKYQPSKTVTGRGLAGNDGGDDQLRHKASLDQKVSSGSSLAHASKAARNALTATWRSIPVITGVRGACRYSIACSIITQRWCHQAAPLLPLWRLALPPDVSCRRAAESRSGQWASPSMPEQAGSSERPSALKRRAPWPLCGGWSLQPHPDL